MIRRAFLARLAAASGLTALARSCGPEPAFAESRPRCDAIHRTGARCEFDAGHQGEHFGFSSAVTLRSSYLPDGNAVRWATQAQCWP